VTLASWLMAASVREALYVVSFSLFIYGLYGLTSPVSAVRGNRLAAVGMAIAIVATLLRPHVEHWPLIVLGVVVGTAIGVPAARRVKMTQMPQMVALFNGVGGGAVALIAWVEFRSTDGFAAEPTYVAIFSAFAAIVGSVSFWGSNVAFAKLAELIPGRPITLGRVQTALNALFLAAAVACGAAIVAGVDGEWLMLGLLLSAAILANLLVLPIGGADMPVVISLLNAFTGLSAAATGVALNNTALIVAGMLVGASGTLLTQQMAAAMNRSVRAIVAGGFGGDGELPGEATTHGAVARSTSAADVAIQLTYANQVVIVPGYGLAVSQAQYALRDMTRLLEARGVTVKYAVHPVAGRMPGHMNVLLAEAEVPYEQLVEMDEINSEFPRTDVALVIGANDVVNPDARSNPQSPLYGMPILDVDRSRSIIILKRSMRSGYAGVENPLFFDPKAAMLFGDAKASITGIGDELKLLGGTGVSASLAAGSPR
jgi:H+-translocating NAD(P) transhydrogenase subunit beta